MGSAEQFWLKAPPCGLWPLLLSELICASPQYASHFMTWPWKSCSVTLAISASPPRFKSGVQRVSPTSPW